MISLKGVKLEIKGPTGRLADGREAIRRLSEQLNTEQLNFL